MCTTMRKSGSIIRINTATTYQDYFKSSMYGKFGIIDNQMTMPNVRDDKLSSYWYKKGVMRGLFIMDSFYESGHEFGLIDLSMVVACVYKDLRFALVTTDSYGDVAKVHHRMPAVIMSEDAWLYDGRLTLIEGIKMAA